MGKKVPAGNRARIEGCPLNAAFAAVGGKWKMTLVYWLAHGELHFAGLQRRTATISSKVLAQQLRELEADGLLAREPTGKAPAPVLYRLTGYGRTLLPVVEAAREWGDAYLRREGQRPRDDGMECGRAVPAVASAA